MRDLLVKYAIGPALALLLVPAMAQAADPAALPALGASARRISVSGLSSGGFMAVQYGVAFSKDTIGVGVVAGGPYGCAMTYGALFTYFCMKSDPNPDRTWDVAKQNGAGGEIDPVANIAAQRVYLFGGTADTVVKQTVVKSLEGFYRAGKIKPANLRTVYGMPAGHAFLTTDAATADCGISASPYVDHCPIGGGAARYDQPKEILHHIYGTLTPKAATLSSEPVAFDQRPYGSEAAAMAPTGYLYVPKACEKAGSGCAVHVVFHGCVQSESVVGDAVYRKVGYNGWADTNRIIILYPQVDKSGSNPYGCWDWWGYSTPTAFGTYLYRDAPQLAAVRKMVERLLAAR